MPLDGFDGELFAWDPTNPAGHLRKLAEASSGRGGAYLSAITLLGLADTLDMLTEALASATPSVISTPADLTAAREALHLSQKSLAEVLGIHPTIVNRWERGRAKIPPYLWLALNGIQRR